MLANQANEASFFKTIGSQSPLMAFCQQQAWPYFLNDRAKTITFLSQKPLGPLLRENHLGDDWEIVTLSVDKKGTTLEAIL